MKIFKRVLLALLVVLIVIQFVQPAKNISKARSPHDIAFLYHEPSNVRSILDKACNDCHSNNTRYPWYNNIQPVAWWLNDHVEEGKRELNFNEFGAYRLSKQYHKLEEVVDKVKKSEMPLSSYTIIHTDAKLTDVEIASLTEWANSIMAQMKTKYPADSLVRKKQPGQDAR
ncbi:MAG: cytochrome [Segetibacter sp.]|nr:cytochrome [Segetibacter sp.]